MNRKHRPTYHFLSPGNWMNDPNGLIQFNGKYHMFYQYNPDRPVFRNSMQWGHAVSRDLVHWKHLPIALKPDKPYDKYGCWTGSAVNHDGVPTILYAGFAPCEELHLSHLPCIATGEGKDLTRWRKHPCNPVTIAPRQKILQWGRGEGVYVDTPYAWREGDMWYIVMAAATKGRRGTLPLFRSRDLIHWQYLHSLFDWKGGKPGEMWAACPSFFRLGRKWVLIVSPLSKIRCIYFVGSYKDHRFTPEFQGQIDQGGSFYAAQTFQDQTGRQIMFGWLKETCSRRASIAAGWCGVMSLPRLITLGPNNRLNFQPAPELEVLRGRHKTFHNIHLTSGRCDYLPNTNGQCLEIIARIDPGSARQVGLKLRRSPRGAEETRIVYDRKVRRLIIDCRRSSKSPAAHKRQYVSRTHSAAGNIYATPLTPGKGRSLDLHVFLDRSVVEVFANGQTCLSSRIYPSQANSLGVDLFCRCGQATVETLDVWTMKSIWK